jgi:hypothetical protein
LLFVAFVMAAESRALAGPEAALPTPAGDPQSDKQSKLPQKTALLIARVLGVTQQVLAESSSELGAHICLLLADVG